MAEQQLQALVVRAGSRVCAIPLRHVVETMRPLSIDTLAGTPPFLRGVAVIRGVATPVLDLDALLGGGEVTAACGRLVTVRFDAGGAPREERRDGHQLALAVEEVLGLRELGAAHLAALPPLLQDAGRGAIEALGADDARLLVMLRVVRLVPDEVWAALPPDEAAP